MLPFPNSVFYLTGISLITLFYATYAKIINKLPQAVSEGLNTASYKINEVGKSIRAGANDLYGKIASPTVNPGAGPIPPALIAAEKPMTNPTTTLPNTNPFASANAVQPQPQRIGGSKKKRITRNKKTKRSRR